MRSLFFHIWLTTWAPPTCTGVSNSYRAPTSLTRTVFFSSQTGAVILSHPGVGQAAVFSETQRQGPLLLSSGISVPLSQGNNSRSLVSLRFCFSCCFPKIGFSLYGPTQTGILSSRPSFVLSMTNVVWWDWGRGCVWNLLCSEVEKKKWPQWRRKEIRRQELWCV